MLFPLISPFDSVHPPAERAESTKVVVKTPEVVTRAVPFNSVAGEEQGDATTLLQKVLEEVWNKNILALFQL